MVPTHNPQGQQMERYTCPTAPVDSRRTALRRLRAVNRRITQVFLAVLLGFVGTLPLEMFAVSRADAAAGTAVNAGSVIALPRFNAAFVTWVDPNYATHT